VRVGVSEVWDPVVALVSEVLIPVDVKVLMVDDELETLVKGMLDIADVERGVVVLVRHEKHPRQPGHVHLVVQGFRFEMHMLLQEAAASASTVVVAVSTLTQHPAHPRQLSQPHFLCQECVFDKHIPLQRRVAVLESAVLVTLVVSVVVLKVVERVIVVLVSDSVLDSVVVEYVV
jgi:hypothetical protein